MAGLYSAVVDGYETVLTPESGGPLTPSALDNLADGTVSSNVESWCWENLVLCGGDARRVAQRLEDQ